MCCRSCHELIHRRIRKENKCPLNVEQTEKPSSYLYHKRYNNSEVGQKKNREYYLKNKERLKEYYKNYIKKIKPQEEIKKSQEEIKQLKASLEILRILKNRGKP